MQYLVYTDAATKALEGYSSVAFLVLKGNFYLKSHCEIANVDSTAVAESIAVGLALKYIVNELDITSKDKVILCCDSKYTMRFSWKCQKMYKNISNTENSKSKDVVLVKRPNNSFWLTDIYDYIPKVNGKLIFSKIKSHSQGKNPHGYVDRLATLKLLTR